jgi:hypothetical protein
LSEGRKKALGVAHHSMRLPLREVHSAKLRMYDNACMYACMHACMYVCMFVCLFVCMVK